MTETIPSLFLTNREIDLWDKEFMRHVNFEKTSIRKQTTFKQI